MVQLPGVNTTQFDWCRTKLPDHPQPVPPIYQPEIPAEAVYWAAHHRRRELWVGYSAVKAIVGSKLAPRARRPVPGAHRLLGQQIHDMPVAPDRPDNLFEPVPSKAATHGIFDDQAKTPQPAAVDRDPSAAAGASGGRGRGDQAGVGARGCARS